MYKKIKIDIFHYCHEHFCDKKKSDRHPEFRTLFLLWIVQVCRSQWKGEVSQLEDALGQLAVGLLGCLDLTLGVLEKILP